MTGADIVFTVVALALLVYLAWALLAPEHLE